MSRTLSPRSDAWVASHAIWAFLLSAWFTTPAVVAEPIVFTHQHLDIRIAYEPASQPPLRIWISDDETSPKTNHDPTNAILSVAESARRELPVDLPPLGNAGDPLWILPASQDPNLLYLGISAEDNPTGAFEGPFQLVLLDAHGPGDFFLWQADLGGLEFFINTRDGIDASDAFTQPIGGHSHLDWGFTTSGVHRLTFQAVGRRVGEATNLVSDPTVLTFHVLPLPPASPFALWQAEQWPAGTDPARTAGEADPDQDGWANLWEYALGMNPQVPDQPRDPAPGLNLDGLGESMHADLTIVREAAATDVDFFVEGAPSPAGPWNRLGAATNEQPTANNRVVVAYRDPEPTANRTSFFYRFEIRHHPVP